MAKKKLSDLTEAMLETAKGMRRVGIMDEATFRKITIRHLGPDAPPTAGPISGEEIRSVREQAHLSQAALARYLGLCFAA
jgi:putative transcriptional regulator